MSDGWMIPLAVSWSYKAIRYMNTLFGVVPKFVKNVCSLKRIQDFLEHPHVINMHTKMIKDKADQKYAFEMKNVSYSYGFNRKK